VNQTLSQAAHEPGVQMLMNATGGSAAIKVFLLLTLLSFTTALLISVTAFTRITIVLSFLRQALGAPQVPPNQVMLGLSLALTGFVMAPTASRVYEEAARPYFDDQMDTSTALDRAAVPIRAFILRQTRQEDLALFYEISRNDRPVSGTTIPMTVAVPAFMVSELTTSFRMGLYIYLPFLMIDLLVSSVLMSLGMMMVPPQMVSLPLKLGVFLLADGWRLLVASLVRSFG
jgi:flagellar biosynthetic protein FliP